MLRATRAAICLTSRRPAASRPVIVRSCIAASLPAARSVLTHLVEIDTLIREYGYVAIVVVTFLEGETIPVR